MTRPSILFRLMLGTLFLPIIITLGVLVYAMFVHLPDDSRFYDDNSILFGMPYVWWIYASVALPLFLYLWMLWSGNWRRPVLVAGIVYVAGFFIMVLEIVEPHTPPDKRMIIFHQTEGTEVYCNGVLLGQVGQKPLKIRVDELMAKVPEWNTPPKQHWYRNAELDSIHYTWFPWDDFRKERFEASKELFGANRTASNNTARAISARREAINKYDAGCRYWWSFQRNESPMIILRNRNPYYLNSPFEKQMTYTFGDSANSVVPSQRFHVQLLADVLPELTPEEKTEWDRYVVENWKQFRYDLQFALRSMAAMYRNRDKNDPLFKLYENALHSTGRLKYGLSDPPTEDECCGLLAVWVEESIKKGDDGEFAFDGSYASGEAFTGLSTPYANQILPIQDNIHESMRKALVQQWKKDKFRYENGWAPVAYFSGKNKSPDYFADFARYSATTHNARIELLDNEHPAVLKLFKTLLHRRNMGDLMTRQIDLYDKKIQIYSLVSNPAVESVMRDYIVKALSDPKHTDSSRREVNRATYRAVSLHINRKDVDKDKLSAWVASLPLNESLKNLALWRLRIRDEDTLTFADQLMKAAGQQVLIETELTLDDVVQWFEANPEGDLLKFLEEQEENILVIKEPDNRRRYSFDVSGESDAGDKFPNIFVRALLQSDTSEGKPQVHDLIRRLWKRNFQIVEQAIDAEYSMSSGRSFWGERRGPNDLPDYILDLFLPEDGGAFPKVEWSKGLAECDSPKAGEILERWSKEASVIAKPRIERNLELWQTRSALRQKKMEFYREIISGRMHPDELLLPQPPWVWKEGEYVQAE